MDIGRSLSAVSEGNFIIIKLFDNRSILELEAIHLRDKAEYKPKYARYVSEITL